MNTKPLFKKRLDELAEMAESYAQKYEPRFRGVARQAYMEGILEALAEFRQISVES